MTDLAFNQSLSMITTGSYSDSFSGIESKYSYPINLYSAYVIAPTSATLSSVFALIDRSLITKGVDILASLTGLTIGKESLTTRQFGESMYYWNETIVEGTASDTGITEQWSSYSGKSGLKKDGVKEFSRHLKEDNDAIVVDVEKWDTMVVPSTRPLPYVEGEPVV